MLSEVWRMEIIPKVFHHTMICRKSDLVGLIGFGILLNLIILSI